MSTAAGCSGPSKAHETLQADCKPPMPSPTRAPESTAVIRTMSMDDSYLQLVPAGGQGLSGGTHRSPPQQIFPPAHCVCGTHTPLLHSPEPQGGTLQPPQWDASVRKLVQVVPH